MGLVDRFNRLVPQGEDQVWNFRAKVLVAFMLSLGCAGMAYWLIYWRVGNPYAAVAIVAEVALLWFLVWSFRKSRALEHTTSICMIGYCVMMTVINLTSGGASWSATPWLVVAPVFATLVAGTQYGKRFFWLAVGLIAGTYLAEKLGVVFPDLISKSPEDAAWVSFLHWFHYLGVVLYISMMTFTFDVINKAAMEESRMALKAASDATERAENQSHYLAESVERILGKMDQLAAGDLTARLEVVQMDEIGRLCEGFNRSVNQIQTALTDVLDAVKHATQSSQQIARSTLTLAQGSEEQSRQMHEIGDSVNAMASAITQSATSAAHSATTAQGNGRIAREGGMVVQETVHKIGEISTVVDHSSRSIEELGAYSQEIGQIVSVIRAIASRTNLLALNASIEAARAGEAGRGFGVIAEEVKALADQTGSATEKITQMIANVQSKTGSVIKAMQEGLEKVDEGQVLAGQAGSSLSEIVSSSENMIVLVKQIAQASEEQSQQSEMFLERIAQMRQVSDRAVREITDIARATEELESLNAQVEVHLKRFKLCG